MVMLMFRDEILKIISIVIKEIGKMSVLERNFLNINCNGLRPLMYNLIQFVTSYIKKTEELDALDVLNSIDTIAKEVLKNIIGNSYMKSASELLENLNELLYYIAKLEGLYVFDNKVRKSK